MDSRGSSSTRFFPHPKNPLFIPFLTVLQCGSNMATAPISTQTNGVILIDQSPTGEKTASAAGMLHFTLSSSPARRGIVRR